MNQQLSDYKDFIEFLGKTLGNMYSLVLFEVANENLNILTSYNLEESYIEKIETFIHDNPIVMIKNKAIELEPNKIDKISLFPIKDENECVLGIFCITMKCNPFFKLSVLANQYLNFDDEEKKEYPLTLEGIDEYLEDFGIEPGKIKIYVKKEIICDLYDLGMFTIKGAVAHVAERLHTSSKSIYRYITEIKEMRE